MYMDKTLLVGLAAVALPTIWQVVETWPTATLNNESLHSITRRDVQNCDSVILNVPEVEDTIRNECFGILEAVDGITKSGNGYDSFMFYKELLCPGLKLLLLL